MEPRNRGIGYGLLHGCFGHVARRPSCLIKDYVREIPMRWVVVKNYYRALYQESWIVSSTGEQTNKE